MIPTLEELGIGFVYSACWAKASSRERSTETYDVRQQRLPQHRPALHAGEPQSESGLVDLLRKLAPQKKATPAQIALAWLLAQKPWIVPIPGTTRPHRLEENIGAVEVKLTADESKEIGSAAAEVPVQGARHPEELQELVGR